MWDLVLSAGTIIFGTATDDSHNYHDYTPDASNPGRGWVVVNAPELTVDSIVEGLATGNFYSSNGVTLSNLTITQESIELEIEPDRSMIYETTFSGQDGKTLSEVEGHTAVYQIKGDEGYIRATVRSSGGTRAWTQPVFTQS